MYLPNLENAVVEDNKIKDYLLNLHHPDGSSKASFFIRAGFPSNRMADFRHFLIRHAKEHPVARVENTKFGTKYIINGKLELQNHFSSALRTVWMITTPSGKPILITAYPLTS